MRRDNSMAYWLTLTVLLGLLDLRRVACLDVTDINVPEIVDFRDNVTLSCSYDMSGHTLNSVKWYKDEMEFFRYSPMMHPVYMKFPVEGVQVLDGKNFCNESTCRVELSLQGINSSGVYRCEVSGDAPHFKLTARTANMTVAALPQNNPLISSFKTMYHEDEFVSANCSSDFASLPVKLSWLINDAPASNYMELQPSVETTIPAHAYNLRRQTLQLSFYANDPHFFGNVRQNLQLKCIAEIESFPELRRETTLNAVLMHEEDDDLSNQKLINSGAVKPASCYSSLLLMVFITAAVIRSTKKYEDDSNNLKFLTNFNIDVDR